jgi:hypothetical protein
MKSPQCDKLAVTQANNVIEVTESHEIDLAVY